MENTNLRTLLSYRLGPWGYLHLESTESGQSYRGNWGLLDQLTALKWISAYAGVFGGDKNQVTLDGCSSGTQSNWHHLTSPAAWPYFHRFASTGLGLPAGVYYEGQKTDVSYMSAMLTRHIISILSSFEIQYSKKPKSVLLIN